ncbi:MAG: hypothetical protein LBE25_04475 [Arthrobacter sp.]|jgi:uncharacterized protein YqhQ|nr:hypothetical protein [Arthrobacter sp.]
MSSKRSRNKRPQGSPAPRPVQPVIQQESEPQGNPFILVAVLIVFTLFMAWYYHFSVLGQMKDLVGGLPMLDHRPFGYSGAEVDTLRAAMTGDDRGQLSWVHKTAGTIFTALVSLVTAVSVGLYAPKAAWRRWVLILPALFLVVGIAQNIVVDELLGRQDNGLLAAANTLTIASWILLLLCAVLTVTVLVSAFVREFLRRWRDPSLQEPSAR